MYTAVKNCQFSAWGFQAPEIPKCAVILRDAGMEHVAQTAEFWTI